MTFYTCYLIGNTTCTYVGITNDLVHRLRQHNGEIAGGAKYTSRKRASGGGEWSLIATINNIGNKCDALSIEKHIHMRRRRRPGRENGLRIMQSVLQLFKSGTIVNKHTKTVRDASAWTFTLAQAAPAPAPFPTSSSPAPVTAVSSSATATATATATADETTPHP